MTEESKDKRCDMCMVCPNRQNSEKWLEWYNYPKQEFNWDALKNRSSNDSTLRANAKSQKDMPKNRGET